jgi:hypothetical protein
LRRILGIFSLLRGRENGLDSHAGDSFEITDPIFLLLKIHILPADNRPVRSYDGLACADLYGLRRKPTLPERTTPWQTPLFTSN